MDHTRLIEILKINNVTQTASQDEIDGILTSLQYSPQEKQQAFAFLKSEGWDQIVVDIPLQPTTPPSTSAPATPIQEQIQPAYVPPVPAPPQTQTVQIKYAGFWSRVAASFIDSIFLSIINSVTSVIISVGLLFSGIEKTYPSLSYSVIVIGWLTVWIYYIIQTAGVHQATRGKRIIGIKVISTDGTRLPVGRVILRETIGKIISALIFGIGYLMVAFTSKKQALHDTMASSLVVYKDPTKERKGFVIAIGIFFGLLLFIGVIGIAAAFIIAGLNTARQIGNNATQKAATSSVSNSDIVPSTTTAMTLATSTVSNDDKGVDDASLDVYEDSILYYLQHKTYTGYTIPSKIIYPACSPAPLLNVSPDGESFATFDKLCSDPTTYICYSLDYPKEKYSNKEASSTYALAGHTSCE